MHLFLIAVLTQVAISFGAPGAQLEDYQINVEQHCCRGGCTACGERCSPTERCDISFPTCCTVVVSTKRDTGDKSLSGPSGKVYHNQQGQVVRFEAPAAVIEPKAIEEPDDTNTIIPSQGIRKADIDGAPVHAPPPQEVGNPDLALIQFERRGTAIPVRQDFCCLQGCTRCRGPCGCSSEDDWPWASCCALAVEMKRDENGSKQYVNQNGQAVQFVGSDGILRSTPDIGVA